MANKLAAPIAPITACLSRLIASRENSWNTCTASRRTHLWRVLTAVCLLVLFQVRPSLSEAQTGPVAAYAFGEGSGTSAADSSGNGNDATLLNGPAWTSAGRFGGALTGDGVNDTVQLPVTASLAFSSGFTFEAWIKPANVSQTRVLWMAPNALLHVMSSGLLYGTATLSGGYRTVWSTPALPVNAWSHVAYTYDGTALRLYLNGALAGSTAASGTLPTSSTPMTIGYTYGGGFGGPIDEVRLYGRGLSAAELWLDAVTPIDETLPLQVSAATPADGAVGVLRTSMTLTFSRSVDSSSITASTVILRDSGNAGVAATVSYDASVRTATLTPTSALTPLGVYMLTVLGGSDGVHDAAGTALAGDASTTFRVAAGAADPSAAYSFRETSGATAFDLSGNGNDGTLVNGPTWDSTGWFGGGLDGDGVNDALQLPVTETLAFSTAFSLEAWIKPANLNQSRYLWLAPNATLLLQSSGFLTASATLSNGYRGTTSVTTVPLNVWSHVACTYDGAALRVYLNGALVASTSATPRRW